MTNGAGCDPTPLVLCRNGSVVRVALVAQVHGLLQRAAGSQFCFAQLDHVLTPFGLSHADIEALYSLRVSPPADKQRMRGLRGESLAQMAWPWQVMVSRGLFLESTRAS
jgi:hypothetical protein